MKYSDLREFMLSSNSGESWCASTQEVDPNLEMTEISDRTLRAKGPCSTYSKTLRAIRCPVFCNLFGTPERVAMGMGQDSVDALRDVGDLAGLLKAARTPQKPAGSLGKAS